MKVAMASMKGFCALVCLAFLLPIATAQNNPKLSDAEVASVAVAADQIDIGYAAVAE
ncbi:MAG TPA: hypothetical protein VNS32_06780 [Flavisolibacter sp.]|nr:hypothetical protein [Flavisolibacter sp.]